MKTKKIKDDLILVGSDEFYDDCPTCQAMRKAEQEGRDLSLKEIEEAFEKSKEVGGIVGKAPEDKNQIPD